MRIEWAGEGEERRGEEMLSRYVLETQDSIHVCTTVSEERRYPMPCHLLECALCLCEWSYRGTRDDVPDVGFDLVLWVYHRESASWPAASRRPAVMSGSTSMKSRLGY